MRARCGIFVRDALRACASAIELVGATPPGSIMTRAVTWPFHLKGSTMPLCDAKGPGLTHVAHAPDDRALAMMDGRTCGHRWDHRRTALRSAVWWHTK